MAATPPPLKDLFSNKAGFQVDQNLAQQIIRWRLLYETRDTHAEALNTPLLGCFKLGFYPRDSQVLFDLLKVNREEFKRAIKQSVINPEFKVASDDYNLLIVWAVHKFLTDPKLKQDVKTRVVQALFFMLLVKFFSSLVRNFFKFGADKAVMEATIDSLTDKYDIKHPKTGTWKLVMEERAHELTLPGNIHWEALTKFSPDMGPKSIVYVLTDIQTRIRTKVRLVAEVYYDLINRGVRIGDSDITTQDADGDKVVKELRNSFESMITSICNRVINSQTFLRSDYIRAVTKLVPNVRMDMFRNMLMQYSAVASWQYQKGKQDLVDPKTGQYTGYRVLISNIIQRVYRLCIIQKVDLKSRLAILKKAMDLFRSSRVNDDIIAKIKETLEKFITDNKISSRDATKASLKIAFAVYIVFLSFDCD